MGILGYINQMSISFQIRVGILFVFSVSIFIILVLLIICLIVHYYSLKKYYNNLLYNDEMDLLENIEQLIESGERIFEITSKSESYFYNKLYSNYFNHHFYFLLENLDENNDYFNNTFVYNNTLNSTELKFFKLILPIINVTLNQKLIEDNITFSRFQFFLPNNKTFIYSYQNSYIDNYTILRNNFEKYLTIQNNKSNSILNRNNSIYFLNDFLKKISYSFIFHDEQNSSILYSVISLNINRILNENNTDDFIQKNFISGVVLDYNEDIIENIIKSFLKNVTNNILVIIFSMTLKNDIELKLDKLLTTFMCKYIQKYAYLNKSDTNEIEYNNSTILNCLQNVSESFEKNKNLLIQNLLMIEKLSFDIYTNNSNNEIEQKNSFLLLKSHYPKNLTTIKTIQNYLNINFSNLLITENYIISKLGEFNYNMNIISTECFYFILFAFIGNFLIWLIILLFIFITVLKISHSISDPIDKLIKSVSMSDNKNNLDKENKELKNYLSTISYKDDSTINDLFILCKNIIIGRFKKEDNKKQKIRKVINSYNNISLVKSNNMIIDENEIMENMKNKEINFFEKQNLNKSITNNFIKGNNYLNQKKKMNFDHCVLSKPIFTNKFYNWNEYQLTKDNDYYQILKNELGEKNKKNIYGFFSKIMEKGVKQK
jgi:hypothetical protein